MKTALILGAKSDIAQAIAYQLAIAKYDLYLACRHSDSITALASDLSIRYQINATPIEFDATHFSSHKEIYDRLSPKPEIVICAFGYLGNQTTAQENFSEAEVIINSNYTGAVSILNIIAQDFEQRKSGIIVGISSVAGDRGRQSNYFYGSAKAGFTAYLSGLRNRLYKSGIQVITLKPGFVATKMTADLNLSKRLTTTPDVVAKTVMNAIQKQKDVVYVLPIWFIIMSIIRSIPEFIFKKLSL